MVAHAVHETGRREIIGLDVGECDTEAFWREFLRGLVARGLVGVQLTISDAHPGLKAALELGRTDVVGIFPDDPSLIRLVSMLAIEANDEWLVGRGYTSRQSMEPLLEPRPQRSRDEEVRELQPA